MIAIEIIVLVVAILVAARSRPPARHVSPRVMSTLAGIAILAFGAAMAAIVIVPHEAVFGASLLVAGIAGAAFLYLARGWADEDEDDDGGEPRAPEPPGGDDGNRRYLRKRTRAPKTPTPR
ncbi:MAG: hypothetical protein ACR2JV_02400 [Gaiellales bacterium]